jgi:hypothetical protein
MEFFREVYADGEPDLLETPGAIKIQFSSSFYHPEKKAVLRQPAVAVVLTPDGFNKLMNTIAQFMNGKQEQALAQARAAAEAQAAPSPDAAVAGTRLQLALRMMQIKPPLDLTRLLLPSQRRPARPKAQRTGAL